MTISRRAFAIGILLPGAALAQRRRRVVVARTRVVVHPGHPVRRSLNRRVIIRTPRRPVVVTAPLVFLPVILFTAAVVTLPARERLQWEDTETIRKDEDWVESNFGVDQRGDALYLEVDGRAELDFADVVYENGEVSVVDFREKTYGNGLYRLLDFPGRRNVRTVRLLARSKSETTRFKLYLSA